MEKIFRSLMDKNLKQKLSENASASCKNGVQILPYPETLALTGFAGG